MRKKIQFKILPLDIGNCEQTTIVLDVEFPNFNRKLTSYGILSVSAQIMEYLDDMDKKELMDINDIGIIIDYEVYRKRSIYDILYKVDMSDKLRNDFVATHLKLRGVISDLPLEKQIQIIFASLDVGYSANIVTYNRILEILKSDTQEHLLLD